MQLFGVTPGKCSSSIPQAFARLVAALRLSQSTVTVVEQSCGGWISASILAQPGASQVYPGGSVIYSTAKCQALLCKDNELNPSSLANITSAPSPTQINSKCISESIYGTYDEEIEQYLQSKLDWTQQTAMAYCKAMQTDYAIAESGAVGPTFRPANMKTGVAILALAGRHPSRDIALLHQEVIVSNHANRVQNMYDFAGRAAQMATSVICQHKGLDSSDALPPPAVEETVPTNRHIILTLPSLKQKVPSVVATATKHASVLLTPNDPPPSAPILDRAPALRSNATRLNELLWQTDPVSSDAPTKFILLHGNRILLMREETHRVAFLSRNEVQSLIPKFEEGDRLRSTLFLGLLRESTTDEASVESLSPKDTSTAVFALDVCVDLKEDSANPLMELSATQYLLAETRSTAPLLCCWENELVLYGTALAEWQRRTQFCSSCGHPMRFLQGGTLGECSSCPTKFWPRQDPSIIVVVSSRDGQRILLANHKRHSHPKFYTVLAGFVEVGETFEAAVAREVWEETHIRVDPASIQYVGSQPWPFPHSCMIGFLATEKDCAQSIVVDPEEIVSADWFHRDDIVKAVKVKGPTMQRSVAEVAILENPDLVCVIPPKGVIARTLIDLWLERHFSTTGFPVVHG